MYAKSKCTLLKSIMALTLIVFTLPAAASYESGNNPDNDSQKKREKIEVVEVTGARPLHWLRDQIKNSTRQYFARFNELVEDEEFHFTCGRKNRHGFTRTQFGYCVPKYEDTLKQELLKQSMGNLPNFNAQLFMPITYDHPQYKRALAEKDAELKAIEGAVLRDFPDLAATRSELKVAWQKYREAHMEKWGKLSKYYYWNKKKDTD